MSIDKETLEYDNNRGAISGTAVVSFYFNDCAKQITVSFNNKLKHKRNDLRIIGAMLNGEDFFNPPFTDSDDWASYEAEIEEAIAELEEPKEIDNGGYGYNQGDTL